MPDNLDFWTLSPEERATLNQEQVEDYIKVELMREGVIRPKEPELQDETPPTVPTTTFFRASLERYTKSSFAFRTAEDAATFAALKPVKVDYNYNCGDKVHYGKNIDDELTIEPVELSTEADYMKFTAEMSRAKATKQANDAKRTEHREAMDATTKVVDGVWEAWHEAHEEVRSREALKAKWEEYLGMCKGDESIAFPFLKKAYSDEKIKAALGEEKFEELSQPVVVAEAAAPEAAISMGEHAAGEEDV